jgi:hypothetical protein
MFTSSPLPVSIPGFTHQKVEVIPPGFFKGMRLLVNGQPVPRGAHRGEYELTNDKGQPVKVKVCNQAFGLDYPQLMVGRQFINIAPPLKWFWWVLAVTPFLLVTFGQALGGLIGLIAVWVNIRLIRQPWHWLARVAAALGVTLLAVLLWFLILLTFYKET